MLDKVDELKEFQKAADQTKRTESIAKLMVEHNTNEKGELLALVHESQGFQEVYDYKGGEKRRWRLERKAEQIFNQLNPTT